ncbi:MAG: carboxypeptidase regulatory-like domain-containing protein [Bacteroidetes bacterium]|nr:MAG: carboxypeptidase regulatory-like domain-containing protein [Bacteroidota bacterium]
MKVSKLSLAALAIVSAGIFAFNTLVNGTVKGTVSPPDAATRAWVMSQTDTLKVMINQGSFEIPDVKPGTYKIVIEAKPPYKNAAKDGITVTDGQTADVGEIKLSQ